MEIQLNMFTLCPDPEPITVPTNNPAWGSVGGGGSQPLVVDDSEGIALTGDGTAGNPLVATLINNQTIAVEIGFSKEDGAADGDVLLFYTPTKLTTIPADLVGSQFEVEGQVDNILLNLVHNDVVVGNISIVAGVPDVTLAADINLAIGDKFEVTSGAASGFSRVAITLQGLRPLEYVS